MTQEEKAKAYDEALEDMRVIYPNLRGDVKLAVEHAFPELAESEDERIRKSIIEHFKQSEKAFPGLTFSGYYYADILAYLEKQKENPKTADFIPLNCVSDVKCEDRWHKVEDSLPDNGREVLAKDKLGNTLLARYDGEGWDVSVYDDEDYRCHNGISQWCEIPFEKQKPADEQFPPLEGLDKIKAKYYDDGFKNGFDEGVESVKSTEWSEEDEENINSICSYLDSYCRYHEKDGYGVEECKIRKNWLKSLRPDSYKNCNSRWKPSEEQDYSGLSDLERAIHRGFLCAGVENVPVVIIKETAQDCIASLPPSWKPNAEQMATLRRALHINPANGKLHELKENEVCILQSLLRELEKL